MKIKGNSVRCNIREAALYLVFGVLTTALSIALYWFLTRLCMFGYYTANTLSWIGAVTFAYITNKQFVFMDAGNVLKKAIAFYSSRIFTLVVEQGVMYVMVELFLVNDLITKMSAQVIVVVLNYIISKYIVFRKGK